MKILCSLLVVLALAGCTTINQGTASLPDGSSIVVTDVTIHHLDKVTSATLAHRCPPGIKPGSGKCGDVNPSATSGPGLAGMIFQGAGGAAIGSFLGATLSKGSGGPGVAVQTIVNSNNGFTVTSSSGGIY